MKVYLRRGGRGLQRRKRRRRWKKYERWGKRRVAERQIEGGTERRSSTHQLVLKSVPLRPTCEENEAQTSKMRRREQSLLTDIYIIFFKHTRLKVAGVLVLISFSRTLGCVEIISFGYSAVRNRAKVQV